MKKKSNNYEYIIWINSENLKRIRKSKHIFIDGTFHHPPDFKQMIIIMYIDIITNYKIPAFFILLTGKQQLLYEEIFKSVRNLITDKGKYQLNINSITIDQENALYFQASKMHIFQKYLREFKLP